MDSAETVGRLLDAGGGLVARCDLIEAGVSRYWIARHVAGGGLRAIHPKVYAAPGLCLDFELRVAAGVLQAGTGAAASHTTGLAVWELCAQPPAEEAVHVAVPATYALRSYPGLVIHRRRPGPVSCRGRVPVVPVIEALRGAAVLLELDSLRFPAMEAIRMGLLEPGDLAEASGAARAGRGSMWRIAEEARAGAISGGEGKYWRMLRDARLPMPELNAEVLTARGRFFVDALWRELRLGVEIDGRSVHARDAAFDADRERQNAIHASGIVLYRFSVSQVLSDPAGVLHATREALRARALELGSPKLQQIHL